MCSLISSNNSIAAKRTNRIGSCTDANVDCGGVKGVPSLAREMAPDRGELIKKILVGNNCIFFCLIIHHDNKINQSFVILSSGPSYVCLILP